jgi:polar amino acid transport system substrate-binding protein
MTSCTGVNMAIARYKQKMRCLSSGLLLALLCFAGKAVAEPLKFFTEHSPPGEYLAADGQVKGPTVELIRILQQRLQDEGPIEIYPWARAVQLANQEPNAVLFETVRNALREDKYQWVGPLKIHEIMLYSRTTHSKNANKRQIACDYRDSAVLSQIRQLGYEENRNLVVTIRAGECNELLLKGRVDLVALNQLVVAELNQQLAAQQDSLKPVQPLAAARLYMAFSVKIAPERVARWQQALLESYRDGTMRRLYQNIYSEAMILQLEQLAAAPAAQQ